MKTTTRTATWRIDGPATDRAGNPHSGWGNPLGYTSEARARDVASRLNERFGVTCFGVTGGERVEPARGDAYWRPTESRSGMPTWPTANIVLTETAEREMDGAL